MIYTFLHFTFVYVLCILGILCSFFACAKAAQYPQPIPEWNPMGHQTQSVDYYVPETVPQFPSNSPPAQPEIEKNETVGESYKKIRKQQYSSRPIVKELQRYKESLFSFYKLDTAMNFGLALGLGGALANSPCDDNFANWYQNHVRTDFTDEIGRVSKVFGEGSVMISAVLVTSFAYRYMDEYWDLRGSDAENVGQWASRSSRAIFVGFPPLLIGQYILGASRPGEEHGDSHWKPFSDINSISGHAFMGAIPFITAAQMTDNIGVKSLLYAGSTFTAWSRVNDNHHYLSQVILGWYLAYLSCKAVSRTENPNFGRGLTVFPLVTADTAGIGIIYRR